jgi:hypothetical protein
LIFSLNERELVAVLPLLSGRGDLKLLRDKAELSRNWAELGSRLVILANNHVAILSKNASTSIFWEF